MIRGRVWLIVLGAFLWLAAGAVRAHDLTPAWLSIDERAPDEYDLLLRKPAALARVPLQVVLPEGSVVVTPAVVRPVLGAVEERWRARVPGGLAGRSVSVEGDGGDVLVRFARLDGRVIQGWAVPGRVPFAVPHVPTRLGIARTYLRLGFEHILTGFDHLLFVLGLLLVTRSRRALFVTISAFTGAHSVTLALAALGLVHVPGPPVEAAIALSLLFVAREIVTASRGAPSLASRRPWIVAFAFGLLHGLGFAGALGEIGLPAGEVPLALAAFNLGVEAGQIAFVVAVALLAWPLRARGGHLTARAPRVLAYGIGSLAAFLCLDRIVAFF